MPEDALVGCPAVLASLDNIEPWLYDVARTHPWALMWLYNAGIPPYEGFVDLVENVDFKYAILDCESLMVVGCALLQDLDRVSRVMQVDILLREDCWQPYLWSGAEAVAEHIFKIRDVLKLMIRLPEDLVLDLPSASSIYRSEGVLTDYLWMEGRAKSAEVFSAFREA